MSSQDKESDDIEAAAAELADALRGALSAYQDSGATFIPRYRAPANQEKVPPKPNAVHGASQPAQKVVSSAAATSAVTEAGAAPVANDTPTSTPGESSAARDGQRTDGLLLQLVTRRGEAGEKLEELARDIIGECQRCKLHRGRNRIVFGSGNPDADLLFVGEGPGAEEDRQGLPFVGAAGQLLTRMIEAMGYQKTDVYICNVVKCRPPNNRDPEPDEVKACERFLKTQLQIVKPKVIVTLGKYAAQTLLRSDRPISRLRGQWYQYEGVDVLPTFHPAYLLRSPEKKREAWQDLQKVMAALGKEVERT